MNEDTLIKTMPLPHGRDWEWYADANIVVLAPHLCPIGRENALSELQAQWRRSGLRLVSDGEQRQQATQPLAMLSPRSG